MNWKFWKRHKPEPPKAKRKSTEDWRVGDLAEAVDGRDWVAEVNGAVVTGPDFGDVLRVMAVEAGGDYDNSEQYLLFKPFSRLFGACFFRKVPPISEEAQAEFKARIKGFTPARVEPVE